MALTPASLNQADPRPAIVQTGAHLPQCIAIGEGLFPAGRPFFDVQLEAGAGAELKIYRKKYGSQTTFRFPWQA